MRRLITLFVGAIFATNAFAQFKSEIKSLEGEKWWGMATGRGEEMPFNEKSRKINLNTSHAGNQASPLLLSNKGRYIWSEKPFAMEYKNGNLILDSKFEKLSPVQAGKTLKDAYLSASKKHPTEKFHLKNFSHIHNSILGLNLSETKTKLILKNTLKLLPKINSLVA